VTISYQCIEPDFVAAGLDAAHFGAVEGLDKWRNVEVLTVIGRPLPRPEDVRDDAAAVTGLPVPLTDLDEVSGFIPMRDGTTQPLRCRKYAEPAAEMIRAAVSDAAIAQAVGRARGVNRGPGNPVEIYLIINDAIVPGLPVDEWTVFQSLEPTAVDEMWLRRLVMEWPSDAAKVWPDLLKPGSAARMAYHRAIKRNGVFAVVSYGVTFPNININLRRSDAVSRTCVRFQPDGPKEIPRHCIADLARFPDLREVLEKALKKPLVKFEVLDEAE
jgi:hypothetical protein